MALHCRGATTVQITVGHSACFVWRVEASLKLRNTHQNLRLSPTISVPKQSCHNLSCWNRLFGFHFTRRRRMPLFDWLLLQFRCHVRHSYLISYNDKVQQFIFSHRIDLKLSRQLPNYFFVFLRKQLRNPSKTQFSIIQLLKTDLATCGGHLLARTWKV